MWGLVRPYCCAYLLCVTDVMLLLTRSTGISNQRKIHAKVAAAVRVCACVPVCVH